MKDPATCSALHEFQMHHLTLELDVDMTKKKISSVATLFMKRVNDSTATVLKLDVFHLHVYSVMVIPMNETSLDDKADICSIQDTQSTQSLLPAAWDIQPFTCFGSSLVVTLPVALERVQEFQLVIRYDTEEKSPAVCWLEKEQTAGKTHPFMYTQGQEVLNRSFFPCQDSPSTRITYDAKVTVPSELICVMSANMCTDNTIQSVKRSPNNDRNEFAFEMKQSVPVYLVAMAVGDIVSKEVGPRSSVWAEPCMISACVNEFDGVLERYLEIGERLFGAYQWERYDILVMPPSFPYGGMENPRLTFVSPCLIAGDQSLLSIIAHEISHSWFGNLVTNASWSDFFLNEGFTMYAERRIIAEAHGRPLACLAATIGEALLRGEIKSLGEESPLTRLHVPLDTGIDPGDCYNHCAYEKGFAFVCYLRHLVGSDERFDEFLTSYTHHFKFKSITPEEMMDYFLCYFPNLMESIGDQKELKGPHKFSTWLHEPGYPCFTADLSDAQDMIDGCESLTFYWRSLDLPVQSNVIYLTMEAKKTWPVFQLLHFLDCCTEIEFKDRGIVVELGNALNVWNSNNSEVQYRWSQLLIKNNVIDRMSEFVSRFLKSQGKQKFQIPIYRLLASSSNAATNHFAREIYESTRSMLHVMVRHRIEAILATIQVSNN